MRKLGITRLSIVLSLLITGLLTTSTTRADSTYVPTEAEANKYSLEQARDFVQRGLAGCSQGFPAKVNAMPDIITRTFSADVEYEIIQLRELGDIHLNFIDSNIFYSRERKLWIYLKGHYFHPKNGWDGRYSEFTFLCTGLGEEWVKQLGDGLLRLKLEYDRENNPENMAKFKEEALLYQATSPKPVLPEEARRLKVQAEASVAAKRFLEASERYGQAIKIAPWWPEGHFNRALILAELQNFDSAIAEMKRYLMLKPDATDARQVQDRIYAWEAHPFQNN